MRTMRNTPKATHRPTRPKKHCESAMSMREHQVFLKWTCGRDILDDGTLITWNDTLEDAMHQAFATWRPLGKPGKPNPWTIEARLEHLDARVGAGLNQELRIR